MIGVLALAGLIAMGPAAPSDPGPSVTFEQSGGITGWVTRLVIAPSGRATVVDRSGVRHRFALTAGEQRRVSRRLVAADLPELTGKYVTPGAADLFVYQISSGGARVVADQLALPVQAEPLVRILTRLTDPSHWAASTTR